MLLLILYMMHHIPTPHHRTALAEPFDHHLPGRNGLNDLGKALIFSY